MQVPKLTQTLIRHLALSDYQVARDGMQHAALPPKGHLGDPADHGGNLLGEGTPWISRKCAYPLLPEALGYQGDPSGEGPRAAPHHGPLDKATQI